MRYDQLLYLYRNPKDDWRKRLEEEVAKAK